MSNQKTRFVFKLAYKTINSFGVDGYTHRKLKFIAEDKEVKLNEVARVLMVAGLEEFEKENPDYFGGKDWKQFNEVRDKENR